MIRVYFRGTDPAYDNAEVTFDVVEATEAEAIQQGMAWGKASKFGNLAYYLVDKYHAPGIRNVKRKLPITPRERQVVDLIAQGKTNNDIAEVLSISVETVKEHVQNALRKTKMTTRTGLAVLYVRNV